MKLYKITLEKSYPGLHDYPKLADQSEYVVLLELHQTKEAAEKKALKHMIDFNLEQLSVEGQESFYERIDLAATNKLSNNELEQLLYDVAATIEYESNDADINTDDELYFVYNTLAVEEMTQLQFGTKTYKILVYREEEDND